MADEMSKEEARIRKQIEKKFEERQGLIIHGATFVVMNLIFWGLWLTGGSGFPWPIFITGGWGIGMVAHFLDYHYKYGGGAERREQFIQDEIERARLQGLYTDEKPKRDRRLRVTEDGEIEDFDEPPRRRSGR